MAILGVVGMSARRGGHRRRGVSFVAGAVLGLLAAACGGSVEGVTVGDVPEPQREALADGTVTLAELQAAVRAEAACIEAAGVEVERIDLEPYNDYSLTTFDGPSPRADLDEIVDRCEALHVGGLLEHWQEQLRDALDAWYDRLDPSGLPGPLARFWTEVLDCLEARGIAVTPRNVQGLIEAYEREAALEPLPTGVLCTQVAAARVPEVVVTPP